MEQNYFWPGAYSFKSELKLFLEVMREQIEQVLKKIEKADEMAK